MANLNATIITPDYISNKIMDYGSVITLYTVSLNVYFTHTLLQKKVIVVKSTYFGSSWY